MLPVLAHALEQKEHGAEAIYYIRTNGGANAHILSPFIAKLIKELNGEELLNVLRNIEESLISKTAVYDPAVLVPVLLEDHILDNNHVRNFLSGPPNKGAKMINISTKDTALHVLRQLTNGKIGEAKTGSTTNWDSLKAKWRQWWDENKCKHFSTDPM